MVGLIIYAGTALGSSAAQPAKRPEKPAPRGVHIVRELSSLRTTTSDTFLQSDGSRAVRVYPHPVNYRAAGGKWTPIDDQLAKSPDGSWQPAASPLPISLPASLSSGPVSIGPPGKALSFALQGAGSTEGSVSGHRRNYQNALPGVSVAYAASSDSVRETLSLASAGAPTVYRYTLSASSGLHASMSSTGDVIFSDSAGQRVYTLAAPTVTDSSAKHHFALHGPVHYELSADGKTLSLVLDQSWLTSPKRVFPVKIDPDVYFPEAQDCEILSAEEANHSLCGGPLYIGKNTEGPEVGRALLHFDVSSIPRDSSILASRMRIFFEDDTDTGPIEIEAHALTRAFTQEATWNSYDGTNPWTTPGGDFSSIVAGHRWVEEQDEGEYMSFGFTPVVEQWVQQPSSNYGVLMKATNESVPGYDTFAQADNCEELEEPYMEIEYSPRLGSNEGDVMIGPELAGGGEVGVNVANGNMQITAPDVKYPGEGYETQLTRYYNSQDEGLHRNSFGPGWVLGEGDTTKLYRTWWDGSNVFHEPGGGYARFDRNPAGDGKPSPGDRAFTSPPDLNTTLVEHEDGTRTLTNGETGAEWQFDSLEDGFPQKIVEPPNTEAHAPTGPFSSSMTFGNTDQLKSPADVALAPNGDVWVSDTEHNRLQEFSEQGQFIRQVGSAGSGAGQLQSPLGLAVDSKGNVWVVDSGNRRVQEFSETGEYIRQFGEAGTGNGQFAGPTDIAVSGGHIWVSDAHIYPSPNVERVEEFTEEGKLIRQFGEPGSGNGQFDLPAGIAVNAGHVWVADMLNNRVEEFSEEGQYISQFGTRGSGNGQLSLPRNIATDSSGNIWVADSGNSRIQEFSPEGQYITQLGSNGSGNGQFSSPGGVAVRGSDVWVADTVNNRVQVLSVKGEYVRQFGIPNTPGELKAPAGVAVDSKGHLWVSDTQNERVQEFSETGDFIRQFGSEGSGNGQFRGPSGITADSNGDVWVTDPGNYRVQEFSATGGYIRQFGEKGTGNGQFTDPVDVAVANGHVWVTDSNIYPGVDRVQEFSETGEYIGQFGEKGSGNGQFFKMGGITVDPKGHVWVTDVLNKRVQEFSESGEYLAQIDSGGSAQFSLPYNIATDPSGDVWVSDYGNDSVQAFNEKGEFITKFGSSGPGEGQFKESGGLAVATDGAVWVADTGNNRVQEWVGAQGVAGGNTVSLSYAESHNEESLDALSDTHGHEVRVSHSPYSEHVTKIEGSGGKTWTYGYDQDEDQLTSYEDPEGHKSSYAYNNAGLLDEISDESGTYVISYDESDPKRVTSTRRLVNGTVETPGTEDEITSFEYKKPESPICKPETDFGETVVTYKPTGEPETFCFDASDHFTGPKSEAEKEEEGSGEPAEVAAGTCEEDPELGKEDCSLEEGPPETAEDLPTADYGISDTNWLFPPTKAQEEHNVHHNSFDYFENKYFQELKVTQVRRIVPWNMVSEAEKTEEGTQSNFGALARLEDVEKWIALVREKGGEPYVAFDDLCTSPPTPENQWDDPRNLSPKEEETDDHPCSQAPTKAQYKAAVEKFLKPTAKHAILGDVKYFEAMNEPNNEGKIEGTSEHQKPTWSDSSSHPAYPGGPSGAHLAGEYWRALSDLCAKSVREKEHKGECYVAAGDFLDTYMANAYNGEGSKYFDEYKKGMGSQPKAWRWGWHAYTDGALTRAKSLKNSPKRWWGRYHAFERAVNHFMKHAKYPHPNIWLTEQGVVYFLNGVEQLPWKQPREAEAIMNAYVKHGSGQLSRQSSQITRFFYFDVRGEQGFDSGLLQAADLPKSAVERKKKAHQPIPGASTPREIYRIYKQKTR